VYTLGFHHLGRGVVSCCNEGVGRCWCSHLLNWKDEEEKEVGGGARLRIFAEGAWARVD
jgi:hypothetical protein